MKWFLITKELSDGEVVNEDYLEAMELPEALLQAEFELLRLNPTSNFEDHKFKCKYDKATGKPQTYIATSPNAEIVINNENLQRKLMAKLRAEINNIRLLEDSELET